MTSSASCWPGLTTTSPSSRGRPPAVASGNLDTTEGVRAIVRQQAEAASKRRMIGALQQLLVLRDQPLEKTVRDAATQMLRVLAMPYEGHAAYRPEWRPAGAR